MNDITPEFDSQAKMVAAMMLVGTPQRKIMEDLNIGAKMLTKIRNSSEFKEHMATLSDESVTTALGVFKSKMEEFAPLALKALENALKRGELKAVEIFIKTVGIDKQVTQNTGGNIQVILPDFKQTKDVPNEPGN